MPRFLLTAFEPFGGWAENTSLLCLNEVMARVPAGCAVTARVYPVEFQTVRGLLAEDLLRDYDFAVHLGQAQNTGRIRLEAFAVNVGGVPGLAAEDFRPLVADGPAAYQCDLPLGAWAKQLRAAGIPAYVSHHAGTYLCNATLYWSLHLARLGGLRTRPCFIHLPLDVRQVVGRDGDWPTLPTALAADAVLQVLTELAGGGTAAV